LFYAIFNASVLADLPTPGKEEKFVTTPPDASDEIPEIPPEDQTSQAKYLSKIDDYLRQARFSQAFWTIAGLISLAINVFLIAAVILLARQVFNIKQVVHYQLINGLSENFAKMDEAHIVTTIQVSDTIKVEDNIPVVFNLPLQQETQVVLTQDTPVRNATIYLNRAAVPIDIILRKGTPLNIALDLVVPVNQTIPVVLNVPVNLTVPVDIPLNATDLHTPFEGLQEVLVPYQSLMLQMPDSPEELPLCGPLTNWFCDWFFISE
jgi:hypothetical protein